MKHLSIAPLTVAMTLALAASGLTQSAPSKAPAAPPGQAETKAPPPASQAPAAETKAPESPSLEAQLKANAQSDLKATPTAASIREKGARTSSQARSKAEARLATIARKTNGDAKTQGEFKVAERLAADFGVTAEQLTGQQQSLGCSWGELMIAHSLVANSASEVTVEQLVAMSKEGTGWGQIAAGLGLNLGEVVSAARAQGQVAAGLAKADGKVAVIHGEGARAGVSAVTGTPGGPPVATGGKNKP